MSLVSVRTSVPLPRADPRLVDTAALRRELETSLEGEIRFDDVSRALYSTDASVYRIQPLGVVLPKSRRDIIRIVELCSRYRCPLTMRGGGTSQAGQSIGDGLVVDTSKHFSRILELNVDERWVRVEPGVVLDELNLALKPHGLRFAPDISTASRATIGGMMANNSSGARSVLYGKTIDHVLEQEVVLSDGSVVQFRDLTADELAAAASEDTLEGECYRTVERVAQACAEEVQTRFPKVLRRVGGYNLDEFTRPGSAFNLTRMMVGSEGTLGVILEAKLRLVPLPKHKAVVAVHFHSTLEALAATPAILAHAPSAVEIMDKFILDHTRQSPLLERIRNSFVHGDPGALLCVEFYDEAADNLLPRIEALELDLKSRGFGYHFHRALSLPAQAQVWSLREAALGLSMAMKEEAKSISFVEDTAVAPERLRDYIERFLAILDRHQTSAGIYAHASVGCLHVRPVVNLKNEAGIQKFEAIANEVADLVLEFGGALSGEHGDGLVRSPFLEKVFGPVLYDAFRTIKHTFDPHGIFNPGKIVDAPPITENLRYGATYTTRTPQTWFDYSEYNGIAGAAEMCSGLGVCRKKQEGTMCPSYMATREEAHSPRGRANTLRMVLSGKLHESGLGDSGVYDVLDLCLECRACKSECPVGVDVARFKSEFLADYWARHGTPLHTRMLGNAHTLAKWGSRFASLANAVTSSAPFRSLNQTAFGIDRRRRLPRWSSATLTKRAWRRNPQGADVLLFNDTFTNHYEPEIGVAALELLDAGGLRPALAPNVCCGRPLISKGLLSQAVTQARSNVERLYRTAAQGVPLVFMEPSCLSAVREDAPCLLRGEEQRKAKAVADACVLFEEFLEARLSSGNLNLDLSPGPANVLLHGHCHQKSMGLLPAAKALIGRVPGVTVTDPDAGCCGMAGSFGYSREHYDISRAIGERRLFPAVRNSPSGTVVLASGFSCRHQIADFTRETAVHPATFLRKQLRAYPPELDQR